MPALANGKKKDDDALVRGDPDEEDEDGDLVFDQVPVRVVCPHCGLNVITFIEHESSWVTYAVSIVLLLVLNWAAICVVPVVYPLFKDVVHHCPRCLSVLATRSRVSLPSFKADVMSFRFGSCVVVLARKYVLMLLGLMTIIGGIHYVRTSATTPTGIDALTRGEVTANSWDDFVKDCGFKSYLGNPIHVTMAFNEFYKNKTFHWEGSVHHAEGGLNLFWLNQRGALFARMDPPQFPSKPGMADLMLLYQEGEEVGRQVGKLKRGGAFDFVATMVEVGRRGAPHTMALWELHPKEAKKAEGKPAKTGSSKSSVAAAAAALLDQATPAATQAPPAAGTGSREQNGTASSGGGVEP